MAFLTELRFYGMMFLRQILARGASVSLTLAQREAESREESDVLPGSGRFSQSPAHNIL